MQTKMSLHCGITTSFVLSTIMGLLIMNPAAAWDREHAKTFATLPATAGNPEALTADSAGYLYVSSMFSGDIHKVTPTGDVEQSISVIPSSGLLLDLAFHPISGELLVVDLGAHALLSVDPDSGTAALFSEFPQTSGPNMMTFDALGRTYVSDSYQGIIWQIEPQGGTPRVWLQHELLATKNYPGFGANGIAFNNDASRMYVANTGEDTILEVPVDTNGGAGTPTVLAHSINGPDGLIVDARNNILVASNHGNEIVAIDPSGTAVAVLGDFEGISKSGTVKGLLSPSDLVLTKNSIYVTNFAIDASVFGLPQHATSAYTRLVRRHTIARIKLKLE